MSNRNHLNAENTADERVKIREHIQPSTNNITQQSRKTVEHVPPIAFTLECILGLSPQPIKGASAVLINPHQILYYSCGYYAVHHLITKEFAMIKKEGSEKHKVLFITRLFRGSKQLIISLETSEGGSHIGLLEIYGNIIENSHDTRSSQFQYKPLKCSWKLNFLSHRSDYEFLSMTYYGKSDCIYILANWTSSDKSQQCILVYDLKRQCLLLVAQIKTGAIKSSLRSIFVGDEPTEVYLLGQNYFRLWTINFQKKQLKQSNIRNIERFIKDRKIVGVVERKCKQQKQLILVTLSELIFVSKNELIKHVQVPKRIAKKINRQDSQNDVENELNRVYNWKFVFDDEERFDSFSAAALVRDSQMVEDFCIVSQSWLNSTKIEMIALGTTSGSVLIYSLDSCEPKFEQQYNNPKKEPFNYLSISQDGSIILMTADNHQKTYIGCHNIISNDESEGGLRELWGKGNITKETIIGMETAVLHQKVCTMGSSNYLKMWSMSGKDRTILFQEKMQGANAISLHPYGLLLAVNFKKQIKLFSILPQGFWQVMSVKTGFTSVDLKYTETGNFLVANEKHSLVFYNPFTLSSLGFIEPANMRSSIIQFQVTAEGEYVCYTCEDNSVFIQKIDLDYLNRYQKIPPAHLQTEPYTCFYFDMQAKHNNNAKQLPDEKMNSFVGFLKTKYMVLYNNFGKDLIAEFSVKNNCYVLDICVAEDKLFAATNKGTIRVYSWPILEEHCELQLVDADTRTLKLKEPQFQEFTVWSQEIAIVKIHKLKFANKLMVSSKQGAIAILDFTRKGQVEEFGLERKKLQQQMSEISFVTKKESEKRRRLVDKTEKDILKVQNEILKEKAIMQRKYKEEQKKLIYNFNEQVEINKLDELKYLENIKHQIACTQENIHEKTKLGILQRKSLGEEHQRKIHFEEDRNRELEQQIQAIFRLQKERILKQIDNQKDAIRELKVSYAAKVREMEAQFQQIAQKQYPQYSNPSQKKILLNAGQSGQTIELISSESSEYTNLLSKVQEIDSTNKELQSHLEVWKKKVKKAAEEDDQIQVKFQMCLEQYNINRFKNLKMHSEVLKMRNQLIERNQILEGKQQIVNLMFVERQTLQNYKQLIKGTLKKLHQKKGDVLNNFMTKESDLSLSFEELISQINISNRKKKEYEQLETKLGIVNREKVDLEKNIKILVFRLKQLKKYLLLQGVNDDLTHKKIYIQQQNLLNVINFHKKRMQMSLTKDKKNTALKKSALKLILKQNKNLLDECNQLRQQTIAYEHGITNFQIKLQEANQIISIQAKLSHQRSNVDSQRHKLEAIRELFNKQYDKYEDNQDDDSLQD